MMDALRTLVTWTDPVGHVDHTTGEITWTNGRPPHALCFTEDVRAWPEENDEDIALRSGDVLMQVEVTNLSDRALDVELCHSHEMPKEDGTGWHVPAGVVIRSARCSPLQTAALVPRGRTGVCVLPPNVYRVRYSLSRDTDRPGDSDGSLPKPRIQATYAVVPTEMRRALWDHGHCKDSSLL